MSHTMYGTCPKCSKPILVGHTMRIVRVDEQDNKSSTYVEHYNCDAPTIVIDKPQKGNWLSRGGWS